MRSGLRISTVLVTPWWKRDYSGSVITGRPHDGKHATYFFIHSTCTTYRSLLVRLLDVHDEMLERLPIDNVQWLERLASPWRWSSKWNLKNSWPLSQWAAYTDRANEIWKITGPCYNGARIPSLQMTWITVHFRAEIYYTRNKYLVVLQATEGICMRYELHAVESPLTIIAWWWAETPRHDRCKGLRKLLRTGP